MATDDKPVCFNCDLSNSPKHFPHFWEHTIGSGHATLALRADWQQQLARCQKELGFRHVRFHGILSDDMGTLVNENNKQVFSFFNSDQICDFLLAINMKPFMELSFMPSTLSSGSDTVFNYHGNITPPRNFVEWENFIKDLVQHWVDRYGLDEVSQWFFEIWNEPNLKAFWTGSQNDYFLLYRHAVKGIKEINQALKIGGPATAANAWISDFLNYCDEHQVPVDFISTHHYPTDAFGKPGDDTMAQLAASTRSILQKQVADVKQKALNKPVYYTEWSTSSNPFDVLHDQPYAAAFITKTVMEAAGFVEGYSYWTFSDLFEENYFSSIPFHGGFGLLNIYGIPKPAYRAFQLLHNLGNSTLEITGSHDTVDCWATLNETNIKVLITNSALPKHDLKSEEIELTLNAITTVKSAFIERIDDQHANSNQHWIDLGKPSSLSKQDVILLETASLLTKESIDFNVNDNGIVISLVMPPQSVACITMIMDQAK
ncbi:MAG: cellulase family glycosylhydrolase [Chryseolinea sp.]